MIWMTLARQFMRLKLAKHFFYVYGGKISKFFQGSDFHTPHMIIKSLEQLFSMFIISISKRTTSSQVHHNRLKIEKQSSKDSPGF
jgi:hypothetical protein